MKKLILLTTSALLAAGLNGAVCHADAPYTKTYANGARFEVNTLNGKWNGTGKFYDEDSRVAFEVPFKDGKPNGEVIADNEKTGLLLNGDNFKMETPFASIEGKLLCKVEEIYEKINSAPAQLRKNTVIDTLPPCISIKKAESSDEVPVKITFNGDFAFPKFNETSTIEITDVNNMLDSTIASVDDVPPELTGIVGSLRQLQLKRAVWTIDKNNKDVTCRIYNSSGKPIVEIKEDLYNIPALLAGAKMAAMTGDDKLVFNALKKAKMTKWEVNSTGKTPEFIFEGEYAPLAVDTKTGSSMKMFNARGKNVMNFVVTDDGFTLDIKYPMTAKKLLNADVSFKFQPYEQLKSSIQKANSFAEWSNAIQYTPDASEMLFRIDVKNLNVYDIQGNNLISVKNFAVDTNTEIMHGDIIVFKGQPNEQILSITNPEAPVAVKTKNNGTQTLRFHQVPEHISDAIGEIAVGQVLTPLMNEGTQYIQESPAVLLSPLSVLSIGGLAGYTMAMNRHRANTILDYASKCVVIAEVSGDGSKLRTGKCEVISEELMPSALASDAVVSLDNDDIVVTGTAQGKAVADAMQSRSTNNIRIETNGADFTIRFIGMGKDY